VDDSPGDALLLARELERGGYEVKTARVDTPEAMAEALHRQPWDLVISDYFMPSFSGLAALKILQEADLDVPCILVSGKAGEETAVEVMKAGAQDFLLKGNMSRLNSAVRRELQEARIRRERKQIARALRSMEERFRLVAESSPNAIFIISEESSILFTNQAAERIFGYSVHEMVGQPITLLMPVPLRAAHAAAVGEYVKIGRRQLTSWKGLERPGLHRDGRQIPLELSCSDFVENGKRLFVGIAHDITGRKQQEEELTRHREHLEKMVQERTADLLQTNALLEKAVGQEKQAMEALKATELQLVQTEKMASLGLLVAGVAHEINNPLSFVSNNIAVLQRDMAAVLEVMNLYRSADLWLSQEKRDLYAGIRGLCERIDMAYTVGNLQDLLVRSREGLKRIQQVVQDLRDFARMDRGVPHEADLNVGIESTVNILRGEARNRQVPIDLELSPLPPVTCHAGKINQVVMNLLTNALDACVKGGRITVRTQAGDDGVRIEVEDSGLGIEPRIRERIFDPFFTTKPEGRGTGLGLSISYGIVKDHGGKIDVHSVPGQGSRFVVSLPVCNPPLVPRLQRPA
jgi:PAS domain S-box-containing protein